MNKYRYKYKISMPILSFILQNLGICICSIMMSLEDWLELGGITSQGSLSWAHCLLLLSFSSLPLQGRSPSSPLLQPSVKFKFENLQK